MKKIKLMTHVVGGYPDMQQCEEIILTMAAAGVSFIEIQIPFSDPVADGPTIMAANEQALLQGTSIEDCFALIARMRNKIDIPILIMTYFNIPFFYGLARFCERAHALGVYGFIIPDMPLDEEKYEHYLALCKKNQLHAIQVISPLTPVVRLEKIARVASGFVYCVSRLGTTGVSGELNPALGSYLEKVRKYIKLPLALGFGISNKAQVQAAAKHADIVVIGSKIVSLCRQDEPDRAQAVRIFLVEILSVPL